MFAFFAHPSSNRAEKAVPTEITQLDDRERCVTTLRVAGDMTIEDARLLERLSVNIRSETGHRILIDIADLSFLDSESAPFLRKLKARDGFEIEGMEIFLQNAINQAERRDSSRTD
jgi:hypothetical protein